MEKRNADMINLEFYTKPNVDLWTGRAVSEELGAQYWYQAIQLQDANQPAESDFSNAVAIVGYAVDEGVKRNQGRIGAAAGPDKIRGKLGKIALHTEKQLFDFGNVICKNQDMEQSQETLANIISNNINKNLFTIAIGGGHDIAYGHFKGIWNSNKMAPNKTIGILNFDAHLDLRPVVLSPNSGTPFYQIFQECNNQNQIKYGIIGLQKQANTKELMAIAKDKNVLVIDSFACQDHVVNDAIKTLEVFVNEVDMIYVTIDMDGFSSAYVTGVSAPSPLGFSPNFVFQILAFLLQTKKVIACDIAELNPEYDTNEMSANLAARLVDFIVSNCKN